MLAVSSTARWNSPEASAEDALGPCLHARRADPHPTSHRRARRPSEYEMYCRFLELAAGRTTLLISTASARRIAIAARHRRPARRTTQLDGPATAASTSCIAMHGGERG